jgi:ornithine cyclodeaminase/alanine dehydrogenase-like protein (mu-crystallin family)
LARKNRGQWSGIIASGVRDGPVSQTLERGLDGIEVVEGVKASGAASDLAGGLRPTKHQETENSSLIPPQVEDGSDAMLIFGNSRVVDRRDKGHTLQRVKSLTNLFLGEIEHWFAARTLIARVHQRVERERIIFWSRDLFFDKRAEHAELDWVKVHIYRVPQQGRLDNEEHMQTGKLLILTEDQVRAVLSYQRLIPEIRQALMDLSAGRVTQPLRSVMSVAEHGGWFAVMPAVYGSVMGAKMVTFYPGNTTLGKHTHMAMIQLFRSDTGEPLAAMDGRLITEMRTAAVSAVAVDCLTRHDVQVLGILGSGVQARSHVKALAQVRRFKEIRIWSRSKENARKFADEVGARVTSAEEAVAGADVVLTLTSSPVPVLHGRWLKKDAVVCAVGAVTPDRRELDDEAMRGAIVVESREAALREPGDILLAKAQVTAEIGELLNGKGLDRGDRPVVFKSVGVGIEDIATAKLVYELSAG